MGYYVEQTDSRFLLKAGYKQDALKALKAYPKKYPESMSGGSYSSGGLRQSWWAWVDMKALHKATTLEEALQEARWDTETDPEGNIVEISLNGEKAGDEYHALKAIAPWVNGGSYIEMRGESGEQWRWCFENGRVREDWADILWPALPEWETNDDGTKALVDLIKKSARNTRSSSRKKR